MFASTDYRWRNTGCSRVAQFDVYTMKEGALVVDCQAELLSAMETRFVVPLLAPGLVEQTARLNPRLALDGDAIILYPQGAASVPKSELRVRSGSLADDRDTILSALDMLLTGS